MTLLHPELPELAELTERLRAGVPRLAAAIVEDALATPIVELVEPGKAFVDAVVAALVDEDAAEQALAARAVALLGRLPASRLQAALPPPAVDGARKIAAIDWRVPRELTTRVLSRAPVRRLLRAQVLRTLVDFARKAISPFTENPVARGIGKLAFGKKSKPTALGSLASAFTGEGERLAEGFADTAVDEVIEGLAEQLADPARAREQAAVRVAVLDALLEETGPELAALSAAQVPTLLRTSREALGGWRATVAADLAAGLKLALADDLARPLGELLAELGLREAVARHATDLVAARLDRFMAGDVFGRWLAETLAGAAQD